jgi:tetratricopeptide (TPR) repeat protein
VAEHPRIEELRRRVQKDRASIAFAQLAEEYRRAGRFEEAIETCRTGLSHHPGYLSAHVTLGRSLIEVGELQPAQDELKRVLAAAPENLAALKGLADIHHRRGEQREALGHYRRALELAPHDPDLEHLVAQLSHDLEPAGPASAVPEGLSFEEAVGEFLALHEQHASVPVTVEFEPGTSPPLVVAEPVIVAFDDEPQPETTASAADTPIENLIETPPMSEPVVPAMPVSAEADAQPAILPPPARAAMQVEALERWLDTILADRQKRQGSTDDRA